MLRVSPRDHILPEVKADEFQTQGFEIVGELWDREPVLHDVEHKIPQLVQVIEIPEILRDG